MLVAPRSLLLTLLVGLGLCACRSEKSWNVAGWRPPAPPQRIVAASVFATEVLLAIAPRERLVGVHMLAVDPRYSLVVHAAQGMNLVGPDPEQLLAARPDLVICDAFTRPETLALLAAANVPVVQTSTPTSFADIAANVRRLGELCHLQSPAARLVAAMEERLAALAVRAKELAGWRLASLDGALHTHGKDSLFDAMVVAVGATNLAAERGVGPFRRLDLESILAWRPDALVLSGLDDTSIVPSWLSQNPGLSLLPCVGKQRIVRLPGSLLGTTSHHLVDAAAALQATLLSWGRP